MPIKNLSNIRRLPRLGKIHLGIKVKTDKPCKCKQETADKMPKKDCMLCKGTGFIHRPKEVDYFVLSKELQELFGPEPKELPIMFPIEEAEIFFQQWYKSYGFNVLKCKGDGANAITWDEEKGGMKTIECPCERLANKKCNKVAILQFLLPDVPGAGVWQISTTSRNSIIDINSSVDYIRAICGRVRMIPLVLKREEIKPQRVENGVQKSSTHWTLKIDLANVSLRQLQVAGRMKPEEAMLPAPDEARDDLLYPVAGFGAEPKAEAEQAKEEAPIVKQATPLPEKVAVDALKIELNFIMAQYHDFGGKLTQKEEDELNAMETAEDYKKAVHKWRPKRDALQVGKEKKPKDERADTGEELGIDKEGKPIEEETEEKPSKSARAGPPESLFEGEEKK